MINRNFKIVYQPYDKSQHNGRRRFGIGAGKLSEYIGQHNTSVAIDRLLRMKNPQPGSKKRWLRVKLRGHGIIDFYMH